MEIKPNKIYILFTLFYAYFILALFECARGSFIPFFINDFSINNSTVSIIISISQLGCVLGYFLAGNVGLKYGNKLTFIIGTTICTLAALSAKYINGVVFLTAFYLLFNLGRSFLCLSVDSIVPVVSVGYEVLFINITHFMYGFGSFTGQKIYGGLLYNNVPWKAIYFVLGFIFLASVIFVLFIRLPKNKYIENKLEKNNNISSINNKASLINKKEFYKNPLLLIFIVCFSLNVAGEAMMSTWFINYMSSTYSFSPLEAAKYSSVFFIGFSFGRLFGGFVLQKIGTMRGLKIFMALAAISVALGLVLRENGLMLIAIAGLFFSVTYPTLVIIISTTFKEFSSLAIGTIVMFNSFINIFITMLIGFLNDVIGSYITFYFTAIFMAVALFLLIIIDKKINANNKLNKGNI